MFALHEISGTHRHIVAEIVETELIVRTESDVAVVCTTTRFTVGLVFVDAIHAQTVELIERSHPFGVTLRQIVIDSHHVHTASGECAEENGTSCHQSFTFTGSHLCNFTLCEHHTTEELHIIVHHFPLKVVTSSKPVVLVNRFGTIFRDCYKVASHRQFAVIIVSRNFDCFVLSEAARSFFHDSKSLGKGFFERNIHTLKHFFLEFIDFVEKEFAIFDGSFLDFSTDFSDLSIEFVTRTLDIAFKFFCLCTQFVISECFNGRRNSLNLFHPRLNFFHIAGCLATKNLGKEFIKVHNWNIFRCKYSLKIGEPWDKTKLIRLNRHYNSGARVQALGARMRSAFDSVGAMQSTVTGVVINSGFTPVP